MQEFLSPKSSEDQKKVLYRNLGPNSGGICGIYSCCQALFSLFNQRSNLDGGTRPPYDLSTSGSFLLNKFVFEMHRSIMSYAILHQR